MPYRVGRNSSVNTAITSLATQAKRLGFSSLYEDALLKIHEQLTNQPLEWGDPEYRMVSVNGVVCHAVHQPLLVRFAVFEALQIVQILEIKPFPGSVFFTR